MAIKGKFLGLKIDGDWTPCEVACSFRLGNEMLPASGDTNGNWRHWTEGYKEWGMTVNAKLVISTSPAAYNTILTKALAKNSTFEIMIGTRVTTEAPEMILRGQAKLQDTDFAAPQDGSAEYNITFVGQGALEEIFFEEFWTIVNAMPAYEDKPNILDTTQWN